MKIAFVFYAEAYQIYHAAAVMFELMQRPGVEVDVFHNDPSAPHHLRRLAKAHCVSVPESRPLPMPLVSRLIRTVPLLGMEKTRILHFNEQMLSQYDMLVSTEDHICGLYRDIGPNSSERPRIAVIMHGALGRDVASLRHRLHCDLFLTKGQDAADLYELKNIVGKGCAAGGGSPRLVSSRLLAKEAGPLFAKTQKTVLFNPHKHPQLGGWNRFIEPLLTGFAEDTSMNLIVAPHVKKFRRRSERVKRRWRNRSTANVLIDPGSDRALDNTYTEAADIYVGDVSSQVYEFVDRPRPCVFINNSKAEWQGNPWFRFWQFGEVIEDPSELMDAIRRAPGLHHLYIDKQREIAREALGDTSEASVIRSADLIVEYARNGPPTP